MTSTSELVDPRSLPKSLKTNDISGDLKYLDLLGSLQTTDLDLPNILVAYSIPHPRDNVEEYRKAQRNVHTSLAFETQRAENRIKQDIDFGELTSNDSFVSKLKRTRHRAYHHQVLREKFSPWYIPFVIISL